MTEQSLDHKHKDEGHQHNQDNGRLRKVQTQQSLNTKNFIKKMTAKKGQQDQKAQPKITAFMNFSNSTSYGAQREDNNLSASSQDQRIRELQERMKQRDLEIQKMKRARQIDENRYSNLFIENKDFKKKSREAIAKSMLQAAQYRRAERREINPKFGYFKDGARTFIQGSMIIGIKQKIKEKQQMVRELDQEKKSKDHQKKQRAVFKGQFLQKKEINSLQKQLESLQNSINLYKEQLKLADKQANCQFAQKGWPVVFDQYQTLQLLGKGGFGEVYKCYDLQNNQTVALKFNNFTGDLQHQEELYKFVQREAESNKKFNHPNIAKFLKLLECSENRIVFGLEYCSGPELSQYLKKHTCLEQKQARQIVRQIFSALNYLSNLKQKIIHYDLKPSNIMFHFGLVKILDFGLCKPMGNEESRIDLTSQGVGTYWYLPPQTFEDHFPQITPKVDVWSTGVIFYEMLYGRRPFGHGISQDKIYNNGIILSSAKKLQFPSETPKKYKVSEATKNFIRQCLTYNPEQRLSASDAYEHEYFKK